MGRTSRLNSITRSVGALALSRGAGAPGGLSARTAQRQMRSETIESGFIARKPRRSETKAGTCMEPLTGSVVNPEEPFVRISYSAADYVAGMKLRSSFRGFCLRRVVHGTERPYRFSLAYSRFCMKLHLHHPEAKTDDCPSSPR